MRLFTFDTSTNAGRSSAWNVRSEAVRLANAGMSGLAGIMLRTGYSPIPGDAVLYVRNDDKVTMASLCAEIVAGLATRTSESGTVQTILNGTSLELFKRRLADIADKRAAGIVVDGRRRTMAAVFCYGCGIDDMEMQGIELTPEQAAVEELAVRTAINRELAQRLDPWAKVEAGSRILADRLTTSEADILTILGVKRGDGQLIHRAASAIKKHSLAPDVSGRCPGKEEWKQILDCTTSAEAAAMLSAVQTGTRVKALGLDAVRGALSILPEGKAVDARALAKACESREAFDAYMASLA